MATTTITMVPSTAPRKKTVDHYMHTCVLGLSIPQVISGILCIIFQIVLIRLDTEIHFVGQGIWAGTMFIISGVLGILSSRRKTTTLIVAFLAMAIIAAVVTIGLLTPSAIELSLYNRRNRYSFFDETPNAGPVARSLDAMMIFIAIAQAILAIMSSAFACHGLCGGNQGQNVMVAGQVHYITGADGQQQVVIVPLGQQGPGMQTAFIPGNSRMVLPAASASAPYQALQPPQYREPEASPPQYTDPSNETKMPVPE